MVLVELLAFEEQVAFVRAQLFQIRGSPHSRLAKLPNNQNIFLSFAIDYSV